MEYQNLFLFLVTMNTGAGCMGYLVLVVRYKNLNLVTVYHQTILQGTTIACGALFPAANSRSLSHKERGSHSDPWRHYCLTTADL